MKYDLGIFNLYPFINNIKIFFIMKKYLMTGVAAIALCAAFTSCSKNEELYNPEQITANEAAQIQENYNQAFIATFGQPAPNHDWGFGSSARTRGAYPNANMWSDEWHVPDALTAEQCKRVYYYFQCHPNLNYIDPQWENYFIQQVYKGGDDANNQYATSTQKEYYTSANNGNLKGSDHMDHLIAKSQSGATDHIFNFNNGNCGYNGSVSTDGYPRDTNLHGDKIQLMTNSYTYTFTYGSTDADMVRERRCALVDAAEIDRWATQEAGGVGAAVSSDKYNRKFMGFDFEQRVDDEIFAWQNVVYNADHSQVLSFDYKYAKIADANMGKPYVTDGTNVWPWDEKKDELLYLLNADGSKKLDANGNPQPVPYLNTDRNMYCGLNGDFSQGNLVTHVTYNGSTVEAVDLTVIYDKLKQGYYPVDSKLYEWVKPQGGADGYYSDWIVTLTKAEPVEKEEEPDWDIRIIAEDLNATAQTTPAAEDGFDESDWDFNDVVFDVKFTSQTTANVKIVGAGGVLPLYVAGHEAHQELGQSGPDANGYYRIQNSGDATPFEVANINKSNNGKDIVITVVRVSSTGDPIISELTAPNGKPAAKLGVDPRFTPCAEREDIRIRYPKFMEWVQTNFSGTWYDIEINN